MDYPAFAQWLAAEMERQNLSANRLGEQSGLSGSQIANVLGGRSKPGLDFFLKIPDALGVDRVDAFRAAGILPRIDGDGLDELARLCARLSAEDRRVVLRVVRALVAAE